MQSNQKFGIIFGIAIISIIIVISTMFSFFNSEQEFNESSFKHVKQAPELKIAEIINSDKESLKQEIKNKVILYDIWTYSCINCIRTIPFLTAWNEKYSDDGLLIIGIHTPEFEFEKDFQNVRNAVDKFGIKYPVILDNEMDNWKAFENNYWPRKYLVDHNGIIRYDVIGEGEYETTEKIIQLLLKERNISLGVENVIDRNFVDVEEFSHTRHKTPELYFGYKFAQGRNNLGNHEGFRPEQIVRYEQVNDILQNQFYLKGEWKNQPDSMRMKSEQGEIKLEFFAKQVNIVAGGNSQIQIILDNEIIEQGNFGEDVKPGGFVDIKSHKLYNIINFEEPAPHNLVIKVLEPELDIFTFTFG